MTVIKNQPLPDGHPLKTGLIVFRNKRPTPSGAKSAAENAEKSPTVSQRPGPEELAASSLYERLVSELGKE